MFDSIVKSLVARVLLVVFKKEIDEVQNTWFNFYAGSDTYNQGTPELEEIEEKYKYACKVLACGICDYVREERDKKERFERGY